MSVSKYHYIRFPSISSLHFGLRKLGCEVASDVPVDINLKVMEKVNENYSFDDFGKKVGPIQQIYTVPNNAEIKYAGFLLYPWYIRYNFFWDILSFGVQGASYVVDQNGEVRTFSFGARALNAKKMIFLIFLFSFLTVLLGLSFGISGHKEEAKIYMPLFFVGFLVVAVYFWSHRKFLRVVRGRNE